MLGGGGVRSVGDLHSLEDIGHGKSRLCLKAFGVVVVGLLVVLDVLLDAIQEVSSEVAIPSVFP